MDRQIITTADGSHSFYVPALHENYHSCNGAITESKHVYLQAGFQPLLHQYPTLYILEVGFGTGLNAWLTLQQAMAEQQAVYYYSLEPYPLSIAETAQLNYADINPLFTNLHTAT